MRIKLPRVLVIDCEIINTLFDVKETVLIVTLCHGRAIFPSEVQSCLKFLFAGAIVFESEITKESVLVRFVNIVFEVKVITQRDGLVITGNGFFEITLCSVEMAGLEG